MSRPPRQDPPPQACPECGAPLGAESLETHLRQRHRIYQFRGQRRSFNDTIATLLRAVCAPPADREAWLMLEAIAREQHGPRADNFLATAVTATLERVEPERRGPALTAAAAAMLAGRNGAGLLVALANGAGLARQLALLLAGGWHTPLPESAYASLHVLLLDRGLSAGMQVAAAAGLLRTLGSDGRREAELLEALTGGLGKAKSLERLRLLQELVGPRPVLVSMSERLLARVRMHCPRCDMELRRAEMIDHLWREHGLLLDGQRVREPWSLMGEWLGDAHSTADPRLLERCRGLAVQLDPDHGLSRLYRLVLRAGIPDAESRQALLAEAEANKTSLCPVCYGQIPVPRPVPGHPLNRWHGRLSSHGYELEVLENGLLSRLAIRTPQRLLYRGPEPGRRLTREGAAWLYAGPLVLAALAVAGGLLPWEIRPLLPVLLLLSAALAAAVAAWRRWRPQAPLSDRAIDYAWDLMAPRLHADGFCLPDAEFLAGLALSSINHGRPALRRPALMGAITRTEGVTLTRADIAGPLAALRRLAVQDVVAEGKDPVPLVVAELGDCLEGRLPLAYGEALLNDWASDWWTPGNLARLRVLLCDRAFEAGFEVSHLLEIGQSYPALGAVLAVDDPEGLLRLRLLWSQRASRPWDRAGNARTAFEFAALPESDSLLEQFPDLLLAHVNHSYSVARAGAQGVGPMRVVVCGRGVALQETLFERRPATLETAAKWPSHKGIHELRVGEELFYFSSDPSEAVGRLDRWFRYLFNDFLPQVPAVMGWQSPDVGARLRARGALPCPECGRPVLPRAGALAQPL
jgi:hypothetical protein